MLFPAWVLHIYLGINFSLLTYHFSLRFLSYILLSYSEYALIHLAPIWEKIEEEVRKRELGSSVDMKKSQLEKRKTKTKDQ